MVLRVAVLRVAAARQMGVHISSSSRLKGLYSTVLASFVIICLKCIIAFLVQTYKKFSFTLLIKLLLQKGMQQDNSSLRLLL